MYTVDKKSEFGKYLLDKSKKIPKSHLITVCKKGCGEKTCKYISLTINGFVCIKNTPLKQKIDSQSDKFKAKGNNCEGL
jgi:hypothetical protein